MNAIELQELLQRIQQHNEEINKRQLRCFREILEQNHEGQQRQLKKENQKLIDSLQEKHGRQQRQLKEENQKLIDENQRMWSMIRDFDEERHTLEQKIQEFEATVEFLKLSMTADDIHHDIVLVSSDDYNVQANKTILSSRSPVFRAMLQSDMDEKKTGVVKMTDASRNVLESFVHYLYTAEAPGDVDENMARELLVLADKYQVNRLKCYCEDFLASKLTKESALSSYVYSHYNNARRLKEASVALIIQDMKELAKSEEYHKLSQTDPGVVLGIYEAHAAKG